MMPLRRQMSHADPGKLGKVWKCVNFPRVIQSVAREVLTG